MFETLRIKNGKPVRLDLHDARMRKTAELLSLPPLSWPSDWGPDGLLRVDANGYHSRPVTPVRPLRLLPVDCQVPIAEAKMDRPELQALRKEAKSQGFDDAVRMHQGNVIECSFRNILAFHEGVLYAPGPNAGALAGTTRARILEAWRGPVDETLPLSLGGEWVATSVSGVCPILEAGSQKTTGTFLAWCREVLGD